MSRIAVGLPGLRQQYERRGRCSLEAESEVQENERVDVECRKTENIDQNPNADDSGLSGEESRRAKKPSERFSLQRKPVVAKNRLQVQVGNVKSVEGLFGGHALVCRTLRHVGVHSHRSWLLDLLLLVSMIDATIGAILLLINI